MQNDRKRRIPGSWNFTQVSHMDCKNQALESSSIAFSGPLAGSRAVSGVARTQKQYPRMGCWCYRGKLNLLCSNTAPRLSQLTWKLQ